MDVVRMLMPASIRRRRCEAAGTHRPVLIDGGKRKLCMKCATCDEVTVHRNLHIERPNGDSLTMGNPSPTDKALDVVLAVGLYNREHDIGDVIELTRENVREVHNYLGRILADTRTHGYVALSTGSQEILGERLPGVLETVPWGMVFTPDGDAHRVWATMQEGRVYDGLYLGFWKDGDEAPMIWTPIREGAERPWVGRGGDTLTVDMDAHSGRTWSMS